MEESCVKGQTIVEDTERLIPSRNIDHDKVILSEVLEMCTIYILERTSKMSSYTTVPRLDCKVVLRDGT